ncbi:4Fe-4S binding protein [candidate division KSB1 bacterium]|nr:4Fe-4S binding protein [candidate division KSB1 bacterium]
MFRAKFKEALICFKNPRVTLPYPFTPIPAEETFRGRLTVDEQRCIACGGCANVCPARCIRVYDQTGTTSMKFILDRCTYCGRCAEVCPEDAIEMTMEFETATNDKTDLYIEQEIYMSSCNRCGRCFECENAIDKIPVFRNREGRIFLGDSMPYGMPKLEK